MGAILVIDDDPHIRELVAALLQAAGFATALAADGLDALRVLGGQEIDLCVVDSMMPRMNGPEFCRAARRYHPDLALLMLTAKGQLGDKVLGLEAGADDYLVKPFEGLELVARVKALLRRYRKVADQVARAGGLTLDADGHTAALDGATLELPLKEFDLLFFLAANKGRTMARQRILDEVWGFDFAGNDRTLDVHINRIRDKFPAAGFKIATVRGLGYRLEDL
ncbi:MAG: response regulator transcription factor [Bifidobacteriaceae bacterium]|nr:response regulator transcription factor [Bifidobacteriaceae bacterium]